MRTEERRTYLLNGLGCDWPESAGDGERVLCSVLAHCLGEHQHENATREWRKKYLHSSGRLWYGAAMRTGRGRGGSDAGCVGGGDDGGQLGRRLVHLDDLLVSAGEIDGIGAVDLGALQDGIVVAIHGGFFGFLGLLRCLGFAGC